MSRPSMAEVDAHDNGDCNPRDCRCCAVEDRYLVRERKHCGRLGDHEPHEWRAKDSWRRGTRYLCPGHIVVEGGWGR